jgi:hypothetical protein
MTLMMKAVRTSEPSVYYNETTQRSTSEGSNLHTRLRENLKSHIDQKVVAVHGSPCAANPLILILMRLWKTFGKTYIASRTETDWRSEAY